MDCKLIRQLGTFIQRMLDFFASNIHETSRYLYPLLVWLCCECCQPSPLSDYQWFCSSHPITFCYSSLSSSSQKPRHRMTAWYHSSKDADLVSSEDSVTAQASTSGKCRPTTCALSVAAPRTRRNTRQPIVKTTRYTSFLCPFVAAVQTCVD